VSYFLTLLFVSHSELEWLSFQLSYKAYNDSETYNEVEIENDLVYMLKILYYHY
jgi:hypothetical protein